VSVTYDVKCEELARHFLPIGTSEKRVQLLAQRIQDFIEDELESMCQPGNPELPEPL
jgi:hypothetical protein